MNNPFGKSLVLIAKENNIIIGVRAFMRWKWQSENIILSAFRAVDTATHPEHQGRGIFKKLTLKAIEIAQEQGDHFIFNTPNSQSKPGYLKMGWKEIDKIKIELHPVNPFNWKASKEINYMIERSNLISPAIEGIITKRNNRLRNNGKLFTPVSLSYLTWRYENNPLQSYSVKATENFYVAAYVKQHKFFKELRVVEKLFDGEIGRRMMDLQIKKWSKLYGVHLISSHPGTSNRLLKLTGNFGPVLTIKELDIEIDLFENFLDINNWAYSLGDLELF